MKQPFILDKSATTLTISLNRENVYNALDGESKRELTKIIQETSNDPSIQTIILTGIGKAFCTGQDLNDRQDLDNPDLGNTLEMEWNPLVNSIRNSDKIIIAAINGICAGAGVSLALNCDLIVSTSKATFVSAFTKIGLIPDCGLTSILTKTIGAKRAMEFLLLPDKQSATTLKEWGLVNFISQNPLEFALELTSKINLLAPLSCLHLKKNIIKACDDSFDQMLKTEVNSQRLLGKSADFKEGINSFFEKRHANFQGK